MKTKKATPQTIDEYLAGFPEDVQQILQKIRLTIKKAAPDAEETISYKMPTFNLKGHYLVYFAAYKKHIGMYPIPFGDAKFNEKISAFQKGKGTLQFPLDRPIPFKLITEIVKLRRKEILVREKASVKKRN